MDSRPKISTFFRVAISCAVIAVLTNLIFGAFGRLVDQRRLEQIYVSRVERACNGIATFVRSYRPNERIGEYERSRRRIVEDAAKLDDSPDIQQARDFRLHVAALLQATDEEIARIGRTPAQTARTGESPRVADRLAAVTASASELDEAFAKAAAAWIVWLKVISAFSTLTWTVMVVMLFAGHHAKMVALIRAEEETKLAEAGEQRFRSLVQYSADVIAVTDVNGKLTTVSEPARRIWKRNPEDLVEQPLSHFVHASDRERLQDATTNVLGGHEDYGTQVRILDGNGVYRPFRVYLANLTADPHVQGLLLTFHDLTERQAYEDELTYRAFHDRLTALPNRSLFLDRLSQRMKAGARDERLYAVVFIDLDNFKVVNDSLGHAAGDELLVKVADRLLQTTRPVDTIARLGGDEFTVLLDFVANAEEAAAYAEEVKRAFQASLNVDGRELFVTTSIGIAMCDDDRCQPSEMLRDADTAMYYAKSNGKSGYAIFDPMMNEYAIERLELESELRSAVQSQQLSVYYQPIIDMETGKLTKVEALLRWYHPTRGAIPPLKFIPIAEETGLICEIGDWVLEESCRQLARWEAEDPAAHDIDMSVNVSGKQFHQTGFVERVRRALRESGLEPHRLELEVTETAMLSDLDRMSATFERLREVGVQIAIDDFGTGYSSISYLSQLPVDTLKIDRSFVSRLGVDPRAGGLVQAIIAMAKTLGLKVTSEGIETINQYGALKELGCDAGQGYLFAKPQPARLVHQLWTIEPNRPQKTA